MVSPSALDGTPMRMAPGRPSASPPYLDARGAAGRGNHRSAAQRRHIGGHKGHHIRLPEWDGVPLQ